MQYSSEQVAALELVASILVSQLGLVKDLNLKIDGTASSVYVFLVLPAAFFKCSSLKWYSHITVFLLDGSNVSPPPSPSIHTNSFDPTLVLLRLLIFGWKLEQTFMCFVRKPIKPCTPTFWYTTILPLSS